MPGHLFASYFLTEGIRDTPEWKASLADPDRFAAFRDGVRQRYDALGTSANPNEAATEQELVRPVLELLDWDDYLPQQGAARNEDIPDHLLFTRSGSGTPSSSRRASASACRSTPATRTDGAAPGRRTARYSATCRRPKSNRRAGYGGAS